MLTSALCFLPGSHMEDAPVHSHPGFLCVVPVWSETVSWCSGLPSGHCPPAAFQVGAVKTGLH